LYGRETAQINGTVTIAYTDSITDGKGGVIALVR